MYIYIYYWIRNIYYIKPLMHPSDGIFPICEYEKLKATNHKAVGLGLKWNLSG